jgi:hypothetical protein
MMILARVAVLLALNLGLPAIDGLVHSKGAIWLGFGGPDELNYYPIQNNVLNLLNESISGPDFNQLD